MYQYFENNPIQTPPNTGQSHFSSTKNTPPPDQTDQNAVIQRIRDAANNTNAKFWTTVRGEVIRNLKDDTKGSRHQKFLIRISPDITLLVAHNIDLAPRVPVTTGDQVTLHGEYAWNNRGGVMHWTHHDPKGRRDGGWIEIGGKRYQ
ncbi:MAG: hypothetical protein CSA79_02215 [Thiothrix nivea]|nr:MAG: hypothetical protein CSA79_02215 [Thiothrix nivea]